MIKFGKYTFDNHPAVQPCSGYWTGKFCVVAYINKTPRYLHNTGKWLDSPVRTQRKPVFQKAYTDYYVSRQLAEEYLRKAYEAAHVELPAELAATAAAI